MKKMISIFFILAMVAGASAGWTEEPTTTTPPPDFANGLAYVYETREHGDVHVGGWQAVDATASFSGGNAFASEAKADANLDGATEKPDQYNPNMNASWSLVYVSGQAMGEGGLLDLSLKGEQANWSTSALADDQTFAKTYGRSAGEISGQDSSTCGQKTLSGEFTASGYGNTSVFQVNEANFQERIANLETRQWTYGSTTGTETQSYSGQNTGQIQTMIHNGGSGGTLAQGSFSQTWQASTPVQGFADWDARSYREVTPGGGINIGSWVSGVNHVGPYTPPPAP